MIIRIDDYPTGIRPILPFHIIELGYILLKFEKAELPYYLGIVPDLCDEEDWKFLNSLKYMIPACHGFDHLYHKYNHILSLHDPYNRKGLGGDDNEFLNLTLEQTEERVNRAFLILRKNLIKNIESFIPPFNRGNVYLENALRNNNVNLILCEGSPYKSIRCISSGKFYIKSNQVIDITEVTCLTFHVTWEWDLLQLNGGKLDDLIKRIKLI